MNWLTPIGFLGLIGLVILVIIYVIKPNYQNKRIPSTYVWRMSLKYRKQRIPISKLQSLLTFIAQALILSILGVMLAVPVIEVLGGRDGNETVIIVDASAGMRIKDSQASRIGRALVEAREKARETLEGGSRVSFILADDDSEFLLARVGADEKNEALVAIDGLIAAGVENCIYSSGDVDGALALAESVLEANPVAQVYLYTGTDYAYDNGVKVVNVATEDEWNAAILGVSAQLDNDNHYKFTVNAACYGRTDLITVYCVVHGVNGDPALSVEMEKGKFFDPSREEVEMVFTSDDVAGDPIYSYEYVEAYVALRDSLADDNSFFLYGGKRETVEIQYASSSPNNFFESALRSLRESNKAVWDVRLTMLGAGDDYATEGFDIYIFEHEMPDVLPTDGVVLLVDPRSAPLGSDLQIGSAHAVDKTSRLSAGASHALTRYTAADRITIAKYNDIILSEGYDELMFYNGRPVMLLRDTPESRVLVWAFDLNYSNLIALPDFSILMYNAFHYFIRETFVGHSFEVGDTVELYGSGDTLKLEGAGDEVIYEDGVGEYTPARPGTYTVSRLDGDGARLGEESFFVSIPSSESDTDRIEEALAFTRADDVRIIEYEDLMLYFAIALVALMFAEWVLEIKKSYC